MEQTACRVVSTAEGRPNIMLRFLIGLGALYAAFQIGREFGRTEAEVMQQLPPVDDEHRPTASDEAEFGEPT